MTIPPNTDNHIVKLANSLSQHVDEETRAKILEGSEQITTATGPTKKARWVIGAMERMEALVDEGTRINIMEGCNCAKEGRIQKGKELLKKARDLDEFVEMLEQAHIVGSRLERKGDVIYSYYNRCYCGLVNKSQEKIPLTYCYCSQGYARKVFEGIFEKPIRVELLQSVVNGAPECKFAIYLQP